MWLCQLLKVVGARTIGIGSTSEKLRLAKDNGAEVVVYKEEKDLVGRVKEITGGEGVKVVFNSTGKDQFENDLEVVARKGTVVPYGNSVSYSLSFKSFYKKKRMANEKCVVWSCSSLDHFQAIGQEHQGY